MRVPLVAVSLAALGVLACSSSSGSGSSIVGEWTTGTIDSGVLSGATEQWFFDSNGTCGLILTQGTTSDCSSSGCTYTFDGSTLTIKTSSMGPNGVTTTTTYTESVTFTNGGSSANVTTACSSSDAGATCSGAAVATYTRVNSNGDNSCP